MADILGVSRASAGEMLKRLEADGLVERGEHKEAILTEQGRQIAEREMSTPAPIEASRPIEVGPTTTAPDLISAPGPTRTR